MAASFWTNEMASDAAEMLNAAYGVSVVSETRLDTMYLTLTNLTPVSFLWAYAPNNKWPQGGGT